MGAVEKTYAAALLEIAYEDGNAPEIDGELSQIAEIFGDNPEFMDILCAPDVADTEKKGREENEKKKQIVSDYAKGNDVIHQLIDLALLQNGMLKGAALAAFLKRSVDMIK
jgi:F0F1-type ATP synthase delta subunit